LNYKERCAIKLLEVYRIMAMLFQPKDNFLSFYEDKRTFFELKQQPTSLTLYDYATEPLPTCHWRNGN